jgi:hypothetical protein
MTRFATFWVERGEIITPSTCCASTRCSAAGDNLVDLTDTAEVQLDTSSRGPLDRVGPFAQRWWEGASPCDRIGQITLKHQR